MFMGSVPAQMRSIVAETVTGWDVTDLYTGCSGNFTIERCLPDLRHHSNDVTLYSSAIGWWAAGDELPITLKESSEAELGWLRPYLDTPAGMLATLMLGTRFLASVGKENRYHRRTVEAHRRQWPELHRKTVDRLNASPLRLASYACQDVREWLRSDVPADAAVVSFPPFFGGDYESMFAALDEHFDWPAPSYQVLDEAGKDDMVALMTARAYWLVGLHQQRDDLAPFLRGMVQTTNRGVPIYLYSSAGPRRVVAPRQPLEPVFAPRLGADERLTGEERITLAPLTGGQFSTLRSQYMDMTIRPGSPLLTLAVLADGRLLGAIAFKSPSVEFDAHTIYLLSDFPIAPAAHRRLAALIALCAQSLEAQQLLQRSLSRRIVTVETTAFTDNQVSMKYRTGKMKLLKRSAGTDGHHANTLRYQAPAGRWSLQEAYQDWFERHA